jgi:hypothetical protein
VIELRRVAQDGSDLRMSGWRKQRQHLAAVVNRALGDQVNELSNSLRRRSEVTQRVHKRAEIRSGAQRQLARGCARVQVRQEELVAVTGAGSIGEAFPPGDGALNARDLPVH